MTPISRAAIRLAASALVSSAKEAANDRRATGSATRRARLEIGALLAIALVCGLLAVRNPAPIVAAVAGAFGT